MSGELLTFEFAGQDLRTVTIAGEPWFHIGDVCATLEIQNPRDVVAKNLKKNDVAKIYVTIADGRRRQVWFTNEPGVYRLILRSHKPEAERFQDWLCREVLPSIRRIGRFSIDLPRTSAYLRNDYGQCGCL